MSQNRRLIMQKIFYAFLFLCLNLPLIQGQSDRLKYIGIEVGSDFYSYEYLQLDFIRENKPTQYSDNVAGSFLKMYTGLKVEIRSTSNRIGLFSGIRYTRINSNLGNGSVFYVQNYIDETTLELLRVKDINQSADYIGIPIEARYFLFKPRKVGLYLKSSIEFNYLIHSNTELKFPTNTMEKYQDGILNKIQDPDTFYSTMFLGFGIKLGKNDKPNINIEACLPALYLSDYSTGLVKPEAGGGIQINLQIPF